MARAAAKSTLRSWEFAGPGIPAGGPTDSVLPAPITKLPCRRGMIPAVDDAEILGCDGAAAAGATAEQDGAGSSGKGGITLASSSNLAIDGRMK